jgi:hypothetical protein
MDFSKAGFRKLIRDYLEIGYTFADFATSNPLEPAQVFLRHDVDLDLELALEMATQERECNVGATFFILVSSNLYNFRSARNSKIIREIAAMGHSVGLHFDPTSGSSDRIGANFESEVRALEDVLGEQIRSFSYHKPSTYGLPDLGRAHSLVDVYSEKYFKDIRYSSDSSGWWKYGDFRQTSSFNSRQTVQLLLHPIWWMCDSDNHPAKQLERLAVAKAQLIEEELHTVSPHWQSHKSGEGLGEGLSWPNDVRDN